MHHRREQGFDSHTEGQVRQTVETGGENPGPRSIVGRLREVTFPLIDSGGEVYGDPFAPALGDVASIFLTSYEELATGEEFASLQKSRIAAGPDQLGALQRYYERSIIPYALEREWLRRHDPELERPRTRTAHPRPQERMAAHVPAHASGSDPVYIVLGAAHQPGVSYSLAACRDGDWSPGAFEPVS